MPSSTPLINGKTNWELRLDELQTECDKADRELWPNRFALHSEYNARRASFLQTQIEAPSTSYRMPDPARPAYLARCSRQGRCKRPESAAPRPYRYQEPVRDDVQYTAPGDEQKFIQRVGMYSNCNVNVQSAPAMRVSIGDFGYSQTNRKKYRMFCEKCKATQQVKAAIVERFNADDPQIKSFCETHRHTVESSLTSEADGRKFRA